MPDGFLKFIESYRPRFPKPIAGDVMDLVASAILANRRLSVYVVHAWMDKNGFDYMLTEKDLLHWRQPGLNKLQAPE